MKLSGRVVIGSKNQINWDAILRNWIQLHKQYCDVCGGGDAAYIHGELSNNSILNAAILKNSYASSMESRTSKNDKLGRSDISFIRSDGRKWQYIESKIATIQTNARIVKKIPKFFDRSHQDAKDSDQDINISITYYKFRSEIDVLSHNMKAKIADFIEQVELLKPSFYAWVFPEVMFDKKIEIYNNRIYPGVFIVGKYLGKDA